MTFGVDCERFLYIIHQSRCWSSSIDTKNFCPQSNSPDRSGIRVEALAA